MVRLIPRDARPLRRACAIGRRRHARDRNRADQHEPAHRSMAEPDRRRACPLRWSSDVRRELDGRRAAHRLLAGPRLHRDRRVHATGQQRAEPVGRLSHAVVLQHADLAGRQPSLRRGDAGAAPEVRPPDPAHGGRLPEPALDGVEAVDRHRGRAFARGAAAGLRGRIPRLVPGALGQGDVLVGLERGGRRRRRPVLHPCREAGGGDHARVERDHRAGSDRGPVHEAAAARGSPCGGSASSRERFARAGRAARSGCWSRFGDGSAVDGAQACACSPAPALRVASALLRGCGQAATAPGRWPSERPAGRPSPVTFAFASASRRLCGTSASAPSGPRARGGGRIPAGPARARAGDSRTTS